MRMTTKRQSPPIDSPTRSRQTPRRQRRHGKGFTLTELAVLLAIGTGLSGLILAELNSERARLQQEACASNLKQWGTIVQMYAHDYNSAVMVYYRGQTNFNPNWYSPTGVYAKYWSTNRVVDASTEAKMNTAKMCPAMELATPPTSRTVPGYSMVRPEPATADFRGFYLKDVKHLNDLLLMVDSVPTNSQAYIGGNGGGMGDLLATTNRHSGGVNLLFCDSHVEWKPWTDVQTNLVKWTSYSPP